MDSYSEEAGVLSVVLKVPWEKERSIAHYDHHTEKQADTINRMCKTKTHLSQTPTLLPRLGKAKFQSLTRQVA